MGRSRRIGNFLVVFEASPDRVVAVEDIESHELTEVVDPSLHRWEARALEGAAANDGRLACGVILRVLGAVLVSTQIEAFAVNERADLFPQREVVTETFLDRSRHVEAGGKRGLPHPDPQGVLRRRCTHAFARHGRKGTQPADLCAQRRDQRQSQSHNAGRRRFVGKSTDHPTRIRREPQIER